MSITPLEEEHGASKFGTCSECGIGTGEITSLVRIRFGQNGTSSVCLCPFCLDKLKEMLSK